MGRGVEQATRWWAVAAVLVAVATGCSSRSVTDPARAESCTELVEAGRAVAELVLERLEGQTLAELEAANPEQPFAPVDRLMCTADFQARAIELGCGLDRLRMQACAVYRGLEFEAGGELARDYLAPYLEACD